MKLLFDQNLSDSLVGALSDLYPESCHVKQLALMEAEDSVIWDYALEHGFTIVSKDSDFQQRSVLLGAPPKVVWLRVGNCPTRKIADLLRNDRCMTSHQEGRTGRGNERRGASRLQPNGLAPTGPPLSQL